MDTYIYLLLSLLLLPVWVLIFISRKDLRKKMLISSIVGGILGILAEFWYFVDYWKAPVIIGKAVISIEDFIAGFAILGISVSINNYIFGKRDEKAFLEKKKAAVLIFLLGLFIMIFFSNFLKINSVIVSSSTFILLSIIMIFFRKDLLLPALLSGVIMTIIALPIYVLLFNCLSPQFWDKYWLLAGTHFGIKVFGNIPVTELFWFFSWGCIGGIGYNYIFGLKKISAEEK